MSLASVSDVDIITLPSKITDSGRLTIAEAGSTLPIEIRRVFIINGVPDAIRGRHAHRELTQILVCISGKCNVTCDDGSSRTEIMLDTPDKAVRIPPCIWAEQHYQEQGTSLIVMCDRPYDENDYIRDYSDFLAFRKGKIE